MKGFVEFVDGGIEECVREIWELGGEKYEIYREEGLCFLLGKKGLNLKF